MASDENWCWKLFCTTCGHMHFRYAFVELVVGKSPTEPGWIVHRRNTRYSNSLGPLPRNYTEEQKQKISIICSNANLSTVAEVCKFPDWLGYLGLILEHMFSDAEPYKKLSESWASQLSGMVSKGSTLHNRLCEVAQGKGMLNIKDLEACEFDIMHYNRLLGTLGI